MVNVLLKSFESCEFDRIMLEKALEGLSLGTCISITNDQRFLPRVQAQDHIWMAGGPLREGTFINDIDWNTIAPIDEELIERMRHCEAVFMRMIRKYAHKMGYAHSGDIPYDERKRLYLYHLRYWNHILDSKKIDLVLMYHIPHQCYDYVIYNLCKIKNIPTLHLDHLLMIDTIFVVEDWEKSVTELRDAMHRLREEYRDPQKPIPLSKNYEYYFDYYRSKKPTPWYQPPKNVFVQQSFLMKWWKRAFKVLSRSPVEFFSTLFSPAFWRRKLREHDIPQFYNEHVQNPDLSKPYVYLALHAQPEASTIPEAGAYMDQQLIAALIAAHLPKGVTLYVKEHPMQGERYRTIDFYKELLAIPAVQFIPREVDTYTLIDHALAVATATGTVGFEAIVREKPVLMFGHFFFQYGPGAYPIRSSGDCKRAMEEILTKKPSHTTHDVRLFLRALEECATPYPGRPGSPFEEYPPEEKARMVGTRIAKSIRAVLERGGKSA